MNGRASMNEPLVSIVVRSFNEAWALRDTLAGLKLQDYRNWELLVIDSGSTDGSVEVVPVRSDSFKSLLKITALAE